MAQHHKSIPIYRFKYDAQNQIVRCPRGKKLKRSYQDDTGWFYKSRTDDCRACPLRGRCLSPSVGRRSVHIGHGYDALLRARRKKVNWPSTWPKLYWRHRWQVEGIHGEAETQHGLHRAVRRGRWNVAIQALLTAAVINLKRLASPFASYHLWTNRQLRARMPLPPDFRLIAPGRSKLIGLQLALAS